MLLLYGQKEPKNRQRGNTMRFRLISALSHMMFPLWRFFGSFLIVQKGTYPSLPVRQFLLCKINIFWSKFTAFPHVYSTLHFPLLFSKSKRKNRKTRTPAPKRSGLLLKKRIKMKRTVSCEFYNKMKLLRIYLKNYYKSIKSYCLNPRKNSCNTC